MLKKLLFISLFITSFCASAQVWQWSVKVDSYVSNETNDNPQAFLWIPENCKQVKGVVFTQHNMIEEGVLEHHDFRKKMTEIGFAEIWVTPGFAITFDVQKNEDKIFEEIMKSLSEVSGYQELLYAPIVPMGHSAYASFPWNFAAFIPDRTIALISIHGDAPQTNLTGSGRPNPDWGNRNIDGIPALFVMGEYEWWEDRLTPGFKYQQKHPKSVITWFADAGHGHFDYSDELVNYIANYIEKVAVERLPKKSLLNDSVVLKKVSPNSGWLMDRWRQDSVPNYTATKYKKYKGDRYSSSWVFDKEMAKATKTYYAKSRGKKEQYIGISQNGKALIPSKTHANYHLDFKPLNDGITFNINAFYADSSRVKKTNHHSKTSLKIDRICGPVKKVNDTTFKIDFYRMGFSNPKRSNDIWLLAYNKGDDKYKSMVQQLNMHFPLVNKSGNEQNIKFYPIKNVEEGVEKMPLNATSDMGLKVNYYVKEGPAYLKGNMLYFTKIPPRAKFPIKVTVVAWQYGVVDKIQSAKPVEQSFYIIN
ncbi:hypothetical protein ACFQ1R_13430 [Mariniflexile jejuense]|uniref:Uncharacterized protein n=1 Tax=Mariniflexile jejuense TaxID=1173582 RepID=A0ABW3JL15_9FLAO